MASRTSRAMRPRSSVTARGGKPPPRPPDKTRTVVPGARHWPLAALLLASVLWGGAITGTKYALRAFDPVSLLSVELAAGDLCIVGGVLSASLYSVVVKRFADDSDALSLTTWQFTAATAVALAVATARWAEPS